MFVSSFVLRSLPDPSTLGPSQSSPCRLFVLLEAQGVRHPLSVLFNLAGRGHDMAGQVRELSRHFRYLL